jgi:acetyl esterase/lipase
LKLISTNKQNFQEATLQLMPENRQKTAARFRSALLPLIFLVLSGVGLFLSLWIVVPAPTFALLPLSVGSPELSLWFIGLNAIAALLVLGKINHRWHYRLALGLSLVGLLISLFPLSQLAPTEQRAAAQMEAVLGENYLMQVPQALQATMRPQPFVWTDALSGIAIPEVRHLPRIQFANPDGVPLFLETYRPLPVGRYPAIVVVYGGAWRSGSPAQDADFSRYMAAQGYSVVAIDYRHVPRYQFPSQLEDVQTALAYIQRHADELEVDLERVALLGRSAGAHLAMLAAYAPGAFPVRAVVDYYGPVNLAAGYKNPPRPDPIDTRAVLEAFLGGTPQEKPALYEQASPIRYIRAGLPASLLVYGGRDHIVQAKYGRALAERLAAVGNRAVFLEIPWADHAFDAVFNGVSNQLALYYTERFLAAMLH